MDKAIKDYLRRDETLLWASKTKQFSLLDKWSKKKILTNWILTFVCFGGLLAIYFMFNDAPQPGFIGIVLLIAAMIVLSPIMERYFLLGQRYFVTDQRVILMTRGKSFYYVKRNKATMVISDLADGDCIAVGRTVFDSVRKQLRWQACHPKRNVATEEHDCVDALVFYCPENAAAGIEALKNTFRRELKTAC